MDLNIILYCVAFTLIAQTMSAPVAPDGDTQLDKAQTIGQSAFSVIHSLHDLFRNPAREGQLLLETTMNHVNKGLNVLNTRANGLIDTAIGVKNNVSVHINNVKNVLKDEVVKRMNNMHFSKSDISDAKGLNLNKTTIGVIDIISPGVTKNVSVHVNNDKNVLKDEVVKQTNHTNFSKPVIHGAKGFDLNKSANGVIDIVPLGDKNNVLVHVKRMNNMNYIKPVIHDAKEFEKALSSNVIDKAEQLLI